MVNRRLPSLIGVFLVFALTSSVAVAGEGKVRIDKNLELVPGGRFVLDTDAGSVTLSSSSESGARIRVRSTMDDLEEQFEFRFESAGNEVRVEVERLRKGLFGWFGSLKNVNLRFEIEVPRETDVFLDTAGGSIAVSGIKGEVDTDTSGGSIRAIDVEGSFRADTSGGSINVHDIRGTVDLDTSGGSISATSVLGDLRADTSGGSIRIENTTGKIDADTSGGSITIEEAGDYVKADTSGGPIRVTFTAGNDRGGSLSTSGGGVTVMIDGSVGLDIDAATSGGSVRCDLPVTVQGKMERGHLSGVLNGGGAVLKLRASGGGIIIEGR